MTRPLTFPALVFGLAVSQVAVTFGPTPLVRPVAGDEPIRETATVTPAARVVCCGGDEVDAEPERREQTRVALNDPAEPSANTSGGPPVDVTRTIANRNPKAGGPDSKEKWHVWVTKRNDAPTSGRFEKIVVHVEPYSRDDCGEGSEGNRQCATATIWLYKAITEAENAPYKLTLEERYREIPLSVVKTTGPTRGLAFRAEHAKTDASGNEDGSKHRVFLITGARHGNGNSRNHRTLRLTTYVIPVTRDVDSESLQNLDRSREYREECIDYVDDAYYDEEDYEEDYTGEPGYDYEDPPEDDSPYEDEPYDYEG